MQATLNRPLRFAVLTFSLSAFQTAVAQAQELQPVEVLREKGLGRTSGSTWILADEAVILRDVKRAKVLATQLRIAQQQQQALEMGNQNPQVLIDNCRQQIDWLDQRISAYDHELGNVGPPTGIRAADMYYNSLVQERNALVFEQRRLGTLIRNLAEGRGQFQEQKQQFNAEVARLREAYMESVDNLRKSVDDITAKYAALKGNQSVAKALKAISPSLGVQQKLGPSNDLASAIKWLARFEGSVQHDTVALHRNNGVDHVDVMLNSHGPVRMVFDTGAGPTTISAALALQLGLKPTGRMVPCVVADGSRVMAKEMIIRTVEVGRLTVKNVACVVMPKEKGDVPPLLGQSFLERFDYKYTQGAGRLVLTRVEPDEPATPRVRDSASQKKKRARR
jgi:clan AA aspartic protease (TIGR02281 family)